MDVKVEDDDKYDFWEDDNLGQWAECPGAVRGGIGIFWAATHSIDPRTKIFGSHGGDGGTHLDRLPSLFLPNWGLKQFKSLDGTIHIS